MCVGIPGKVVEIYEDLIPTAKVDVGGVRRQVNIDLVHDADNPLQVGDWVLIHVGFAMSRIDEKEAQQTLALLREISEQEGEWGKEGKSGAEK